MTENTREKRLTAFVINMDRDVARLEHMRGQLARFSDFDVVRSHGLTPDEWRQYGLKGFSPIRSFIASGRKMRPGQIGCTYSHLWVYHQILERGLPYALVFEDDVILDDEFGRRVEAVLARVSPDKRQFYLFSAVDGDASCKKEEIRRLRRAWGADAYLVTREAARMFIAKNEPVLVICDTLKRFVRYFGLELYRVFPITARQVGSEFESNVPQAPKPPGWVRGLLAVLDGLLVIVGR